MSDMDQNERPRVDVEGAAGYADRFIAGETEADVATENAAVTVPVTGGDPLTDPQALRSAAIDVLSSIYDPEIPVNIYEMGLIYGVEVDPAMAIMVTMTLTSPNCPVAESMPGDVEQQLGCIPGANGCDVNLVWDPPWDMSMMSEAARLELGFL